MNDHGGVLFWEYHPWGNTELKNSSTIVSPQTQSAEAVEPDELASHELSEPAVAVKSINSDMNSDISAENALDCQTLGIKKFGQKIKTKSSNYFLKITTKEKRRRKGMKP